MYMVRSTLCTHISATEKEKLFGFCTIMSLAGKIVFQVFFGEAGDWVVAVVQNLAVHWNLSDCEMK